MSFKEKIIENMIEKNLSKSSINNYIRNLEIFSNLHDGSSSNTLFECLQKTVTGMGARRLRAWLARPLREIQPDDFSGHCCWLSRSACYE